MTYLDYINYFWRKDREFFFKPEEVAIYFRLLDHANNIGWKEHFNMSLDRLMLEVGVKSRKPFDNARQRLRDAGLLEFKNGNGRGCTTEYTLLSGETFPKRGAKNTPLSGTLSGEVSGKNKERFGKEKVAVHKSKSKIIESDDSASAGEDSASNPPAEATPPESWATWLAANAPDVQRMRQPLTADQWANLVRDFGELMTRDVLLAMHNTTGAEKKYKSAYLTARNWCNRRQPSSPAQPMPPPPTGHSTTSTQPELNPEIVAQRQAARDAEAAANRSQFRANRGGTAAA